MDDPPPATPARVPGEGAGALQRGHELDLLLLPQPPVKPFDNPEVRKAVNYAIDKRALARLFGGQLEPGCNFLPPGMQGYEKIEPCPYGDPKAAPDIEKAKQLIQEAGVAGERSPSGQRRGADKASRSTSPTCSTRSASRRSRGSSTARSTSRRSAPRRRRPSRLHELVPGLPAPGELPVPGRRQHPGDEQPELRQRRRPERSRRCSTKPTEEDLTRRPREYADLDKQLVEQGVRRALRPPQAAGLHSERMDFDPALFHPVLQADYTTFA